jgi:hypothetical protein
MPEPDDDLRNLRAADALDPASVPSATDPQARQLFERITMTVPAETVRRRRVVLAAAAAVAVLAVAGAGIALTRDTGGGSSANVAARPTTTVGDATAPITPGGASIGSCVERYDLTTLARRQTVFDGTVDAANGDDVAFTVNRWYRGGDPARVTLAGASTSSGITTAGPGAPLAPGTRLLVAGDGGFAWACGFTQPYDAAVAARWARALAG